MKISILGCGWLGLPLAETLLGKGHRISGSTTREEKLEELRNRGIDPYRIRLDPGVNCRNCEPFWDTDLLILNFPPGRKRDDLQTRLPSQVRALLTAIAPFPVRQIIFISSTSVYRSGPGTVREEDAKPGRASSDAGNALLEAERLLLEGGTPAAVIRFGGLYGADRHPVRYLAGREGLDRGDAPVNLIHRDDCIGIIERIIERQPVTGVFNGVADRHPTRRECYRRVAETMGLEPPGFTSDRQGDKTVSNRKVREELYYSFIHPDPTDYSGESGG